MRFHFVVGCAQSLNVAADQVSFAEQITGIRLVPHGLGDAVLAVPFVYRPCGDYRQFMVECFLEF